MKSKQYPRVLLLSNNALRSGGSNGKVLQELFEGWNPECLAQFFIYDEQPDFTVCRNFFRVTDREAVGAFLAGKKPGTVISESKEASKETAKSSGGGIRRNPLTSLLRDIIWNSGRWKSRAFYCWVEEFNPELILLQVGDSSLTANIAIELSKKYRIPIVLYCTENYYFKKHNYLAGTGFGFVYPLFRLQMTGAFRKLMKRSVCEIYNSEYLAQLYEEAFGKKGYVIYQASSLKTMPPTGNGAQYRFCYTGNLGLNRHEGLIAIAQVLQKLSASYRLDVYGRASESVAAALEKEPGICFHGPVPYSQVLEAMAKSDFLFHAESFDPFMVKDLQTAFSTKIADSLASGRCFVLYAHESLACTRYLAAQGGAYVITDPKQLEPKLRSLVKDPALQEALIVRGQELALQNHSAAANSKAFLDIINAACASYEEKSNG